MNKPFVNDIQKEILFQQAAVCNFRPMGITVHECMIAGEVLAQLFGDVPTLVHDSAVIAQAERTLKDHGFKGAQLQRMLGAVRDYMNATLRQAEATKRLSGSELARKKSDS